MIELDPRQTIILAILVLFLGKYLTRKVRFFREFNIPEPVTGGVLASLVFGGVIGGPIAKFLVQRHGLKPAQSETPITVGLRHDREDTHINVDNMLSVILVISLAVGVGLHAQLLLVAWGIKLPVFVTCLFGGIVLTNTVPYLMPRLSWPTGTPTLALVSDLSLGLFWPCR